MMRHRSLYRSVAVLASATLVVACGDLLGSNFVGLNAESADAGDDTGATRLTDATDDTGTLHAASPDASEASDDAGPTQDGMADASDASVADASDASVADASDASILPDGASVIYPSAVDVAIGPTDDAIWILGGILNSDANYPAYQWSADSHSFVAAPSIDYEGNAIGVTSNGPCFVRQDETVVISQSSTQLVLYPSTAARAIGASSDSVWVVSLSSQPEVLGEFKVYLWDGSFADATFYAEPSVYGTRIAVAADGSAWLTLGTGGIVHAIQENDAGGTYEPLTISLPGNSTDIGVGAAGVYALGQASDGGTPSLFKYSTTANAFSEVLTLDATRIAVGTAILVVLMSDGRVVSFPAP